MYLAFVCAAGEAEDERHTTSIAMVACTHCGKFAVGGYICDDCDHSDIDPADQLTGHGPGECLPTTEN